MNIKKDCKIYIISSKDNEKYYERYCRLEKLLINNEFDKKNIELINYIQNTTYERSLALTSISIYEKVLNECSSEMDFKPFIILEDDCDFTDFNYNFIIDNIYIKSKNVDAIYLGLSECNSHESYLLYDIDMKLKIKNIDDTYFQIFNMLSAHSILYMRREYVKFLYKYLYDIYLNQNSNIIWDLYLARIQCLRTIYALKEPIFYQNDIKNINLTKINYRHLIQRSHNNPLLTYKENILYQTIGDILYFKEPKFVDKPNVTNEVVFVTSYFEMNNKQGNNDIYYSWMKNLLENLNQPLIIYTDYKSYDKIRKMRGYLINKTIIHLTSLDDMYMSKYNHILKHHHTIDNEKNIHNVNLYKIWNEKIHYIKKSVDNNILNGNYYIWIDIGFFRDKNCNTLLKHFPDINKIKTEIQDKVGILQIQEIHNKYLHLIDESNNINVLTRYDLNNELYTFGGGFLIFHKNNINKIHDLYFELMDKYISKDRFIGKDQILYANLTITHPELFKIINHVSSNKYNRFQQNIWFYMFNHFLPDKPIVSSFLMGGLCNQLYQILMAYTYCQRNDCIYMLDISKRMINPHSVKNYFEMIFKKLPIFNNVTFNYLVDEEHHKCLTYTNYNKTNNNTIFRGYFQSEKYFEENVKFLDDIFDFNEYINYLPIDYDSIFIHIRLGDYKNHELHDVKLIEKGYYKKSIEYINKLYPNIKYKVFSNDIQLAKTLLVSNYFENNSVEFIDENDEIKSIFMMSKCYKGGIGANSSYSWFANLFNRNPNKTFILPNKWFNNDNNNITDMYPKNCVIIDI